MKSALLIAAALAALVAPAAAQAPAAKPPEPLPPSLAPDRISPGTYVVVTKETLVRYTTIHMGSSEFWGTFPGATGTLEIDPAHLERTKLSVSVPVATIETTNRELDAELVSDEFFSQQKFHRMQFVSTGVTRTGPTTAKVAGDLTLHGVTRPVVLDVAFIGAGPNSFSKVPTMGFRAHGSVKRSDFGIAKYVPIVSDETQIDIAAAFEKKPG